MTADPERDGDINPSPAQDVLQSMQRVGDHLLAGMEGDSRVQSGVPGGQPATDLDFIQMTGLTRPKPVEEPIGETARPSQPQRAETLNFYEKGVADVDTTFTPEAREDREDLDVLPSEAPPSTPVRENYSIAELKKIINDLAQGDTPSPDGEPVSAAPLVNEPVSSEAEVDAAETFTADASVEAEIGNSESEGPIWPSPSKSDTLAELLERELTNSEGASEDASAPDLETDVPTVDAESSPLLDPVQESPETPELEPSATESGLEHSEDLAGMLEDLGENDGLEVPEEVYEDATAAPSERVSQNASDTEPADAPPFTHDLTEVEQLLKTLQEQPRDVPVAEAPARSEPDGAEDSGDSFGQERDESVYRKPQDRRRKRSSHVHGRLRRRLRRLGVGLLVAVALGLGYLGYRWSEQGLASPAALFADADHLVAKGQYSEAAIAYQDFVTRYPNDPKRAAAQFNAAFYSQVASSDAEDATLNPTDTAKLERAVKRFQQFLEDNPLDAKAPRARTLLGLLQYRLKHYQEAIDQLQKPSVRLNDPTAALVILRTLAECYAHLGDFDSARSAYLQAASLSDNYSPDYDYKQLSDLCKDMAEHASTPQEARRYLKLSVEELGFAIRAPGIDPVSKKQLQSLIAAREPDANAGVSGVDGNENEAATASDATTAASVAKAKKTATEVTAPVSSSGGPPAAPLSKTLNADPDPYQEAAQLRADAATGPSQAGSKGSR